MAGSEYGNNYRGREPTQYSAKVVDHLDSREILEAYRDPDVQPAEDVGCQGGRRDIWNRSWEKLALEGRPGHLEHGPSSINEGRLYTGQYGESHRRAMNFALDLSMKASVEAQKDFLEIQQALHPERALARWEDLKRRAPDAFGKDWDPAEMAARKESARPQFSMSEIIDTMGEDFARRTQEGAQSLPSRKRGVDGALTVPPRVRAVPPVRNASASSMQSPPARADAPGCGPSSTWERW